MNKTAPMRNSASNQTSTTKKNRGPLSPTRKPVGVERESPFKKANTTKPKTVQKTKQAPQSPNQESKIDKKKEEAKRKRQEDIDKYNKLMEERNQKIAQRDQLLEQKRELLEQRELLQSNAEDDHGSYAE